MRRKLLTAGVAIGLLVPFASANMAAAGVVVRPDTGGSASVCHVLPQSAAEAIPQHAIDASPALASFKPGAQPCGPG
jgi:hypothetical protein